MEHFNLLDQYPQKSIHFFLPLLMPSSFMGSVASDSLRLRELQPAGLPCPLDSPGNDTGAGCHFILQGMFSTQGSNPCLLWPLYWQANSFLLATWEALPSVFILPQTFSELKHTAAPQEPEGTGSPGHSTPAVMQLSGGQ